jgi:hypothetical protein
MKTFSLSILHALVLALSTPAAPAQDAQRDRNSRFVDAVGIDTDADGDATAMLQRPILTIDGTTVLLRAPAGAAYAIWAGFADGDQGKIEPVLVLGCGCVDEDGMIRCALGWVDGDVRRRPAGGQRPDRAAPPAGQRQRRGARAAAQQPGAGGIRGQRGPGAVPGRSPP